MEQFVHQQNLLLLRKRLAETPNETWREYTRWIHGNSPLVGKFAMPKIIQANINRFRLLLKTETDPTKRAMLIRLLAEEEAKKMPAPEQKEA